jgi:hypothetical protein
MELYSLKLKLIDWILKQEKEDLLKDLDTKISGLDKESEDLTQVIGHRSYGARVTLSDFIEQLKELEKSSAENITLEELERQSENW